MSLNFESIVSDIISDSPAGEIKEIYNDLITIAGENAKQTILEAIEQYNIKNALPIDVNGKSVIISEYNRQGTKYFDPKTSTSFSVDHLNRTGLDIESNDVKLTTSQELIYDSLENYIKSNFPGEVAFGLYPIPEEENKIAIIIFGNKYNQGSFWTGDWKSKYVYDIEEKKLTGSIAVQVHYFEDGNVNFEACEKVDLNDVNDVVESLSQVESKFEKDLDSSFTDLNEKQFKVLRRKLPITRSKVSWGKAIGNYRLGKDAAQGK
ncbi:hypothetical protein KAFR_0D03350 [Kazachstania africana CBS 2517]|uniref:F-actin-capping protein subunit alpha n=1 Tax=Kazachstania africana (strain ATCC 22294 / BCRC 22015 / CBS 2517 / CECT 1963 / NBRC 1671 / NRRL Y-8276) TaxID=1071382 RepID=H2AUD3_KAZAF|nr:hypothetical protein KAFR_0D03350 [Kazachstania africana CBS 2517]CCF57983.1 hypothetical protein KAFR_0D03350 [Kazachstania africana CBS 2517]